MKNCTYCRCSNLDGGLKLSKAVKLCKECLSKNKERMKFIDCFMITCLNVPDKALYYLIKNSLIDENEFNTLYKTHIAV